MSDTHVELRGISRSFGGVQAVRDLNLKIERGTTHGVVGENGAGKSTVGKVIAGAIAPSAGGLVVDGAEVQFASPRQAHASGINLIDQELALVQARSVMQNVFLGAEPRRRGRLDRKAQRARFAELIERTGFDLEPDTPVRALSVAQQQKVEILRAISRDASFIIMDEPTAPLTVVEAEQLYTIIKQLRASGTTILYISHFLEEVLEISDVVTVMRDGSHVSTGPASEATVDSLVRSMLGRPLDLTFPAHRPSPDSQAPVLQVRNVSTKTGISDVSLDVHAGEIVGLAGLIGSGRTELARAIFGADPLDGGEVLLDGTPGLLRSPRRAIEHGVVLLPENRRDNGLIMNRSVAENIVLSQVQRVSRLGVVQAGRRREKVAELMRELDIRADGQKSPVRNLSGGNQQKVLFAKCLVAEPRVLIVDEPTRGVDVGAKRAIYDLLVSLAADGMAILAISSELDEVSGLAHRVLVMRRGSIVAEMARDEFDAEAILSAAFGTAAAA